MLTDLYQTFRTAQHLSTVRVLQEGQQGLWQCAEPQAATTRQESNGSDNDIVHLPFPGSDSPPHLCRAPSSSHAAAPAGLCRPSTGCVTPAAVRPPLSSTPEDSAAGQSTQAPSFLATGTSVRDATANCPQQLCDCAPKPCQQTGPTRSLAPAAEQRAVEHCQLQDSRPRRQQQQDCCHCPNREASAEQLDEGQQGPCQGSEASPEGSGEAVESAPCGAHNHGHINSTRPSFHSLAKAGECSLS